MLKAFYCKQGHPFKRDRRPERCPTCGDTDVFEDKVDDQLTEFDRQLLTEMLRGQTPS